MAERVLVLGGYGLLGSYIQQTNHFDDLNLFFHGRHSSAYIQANLEDRDQVYDMLKKIKPDLVINLAALTDVDKCEEFPNQAFKNNVETVDILSECLSLEFKDTFFIHLSTDQVYGIGGPSSEDNINLLNYYAFSKYTAERILYHSQATILRTNFFGKSLTAHRSSITDWLYAQLQLGTEVNLFEDVLFSPLSMNSLCRSIRRCVEKKVTGTFNLGSRDGFSKALFAFKFADELGVPSTFFRSSTIGDANFLKAYRPRDMRMDVSKFERVFDCLLPTLESEINVTAKEYLK